MLETDRLILRPWLNTEAEIGYWIGVPCDEIPGVHSIWKGIETLYILLAYREFFV